MQQADQTILGIAALVNRVILRLNFIEEKVLSGQNTL